MRSPRTLAPLFCLVTLLAQTVPAPGVADSQQDPEIARLTDMVLRLQNDAAQLSAERPEDAPRLRANLQQQITTCTELLRRNTESNFALQGKINAEKSLAQMDGKIREEEGNRQKGEASLGAVWSSLARRDVAAAVAALATARAMLPNDDRVAVAGRAVDRANTINKIRGFSLGGLLAAFLGGLGMWLRGKSKNTQPLLAILSGPLAGRQFPMEQEVVHLGAIRGDDEKDNDLVIEDQTKRISRFHCYVGRRKGSYFVVDKNSQNGTYINDRRIPGGVEVPIRKGDRLDLAHVCVFEFRLVKNK